MRNKLWLIIIALAVAMAGWGWFSLRPGKKSADRVDWVRPAVGTIRTAVTATGTVKPQNRLEIKPAIAGRIDEILVREGDRVRQGQVLANMSSTDRAALLDAARPQGREAIDYWSQVYKSTPILSPISGTVIVRSVEPGQTVSMSDSVIVLSDRLIVQAAVDETDIGKVHLGQLAVITLDAYPQIHVEAKVDHIAYESTTTNNVTTYNVDILPEKVPPVFRSGMSANVEIVTAEKKDVLTLPVEAVIQRGRKSLVKIDAGPGNPPRRQAITTGLSDEKAIEIVDGLSPEDRVAVERPDYSALSENQKSNPFMPRRPRGGRSSGGGRGPR